MCNSVVSVPDHCLFISDTHLACYTYCSLEANSIHVYASRFELFCIKIKYLNCFFFVFLFCFVLFFCFVFFFVLLLLFCLFFCFFIVFVFYLLSFILYSANEIQKQ